MDAKTVVLKTRAEKGRMMYRASTISQEDAKKMVMPYIEAVNAKAKELAKKYNQRARITSFRAFVR